jgi:two-component sensor histidine kinase
VHELLTERREEDVELGDLVDRLRAMLVQGVGGGKEVSSELAAVTLSGARATALALVFAELLQNALEHGGDRIRVELARRDGEVVLAIADDGDGLGAGAPAGTGLSIVRALVRDELRGRLELASGPGTRVEVRFPAA